MVVVVDNNVRLLHPGAGITAALLESLHPAASTSCSTVLEAAGYKLSCKPRSTLVPLWLLGPTRLMAAHALERDGEAWFG